MHPSAICFFLSIITRFIYVDTYKHIKNLYDSVHIQYTHVTIYLSITKWCHIVLKSAHTNFSTHCQYIRVLPASYL